MMKFLGFLGQKWWCVTIQRNNKLRVTIQRNKLFRTQRHRFFILGTDDTDNTVVLMDSHG